MCVIEYIFIISVYDVCTNWKRHNVDKLWLILFNARKLTCTHFTSQVNIFVQYGLIKVTIYAFVKEFILKGVFGNSGCNFASFSHLCQRYSNNKSLHYSDFTWTLIHRKWLTTNRLLDTLFVIATFTLLVLYTRNPLVFSGSPNYPRKCIQVITSSYIYQYHPIFTTCQ